MVTISDWYIFTCMKYHLACAYPAAMCLMKKYLVFLFFNVAFMLSYWSLVAPSEPPWLPACNWYQILLFLSIRIIMVFASFITWPIITGVTSRPYTCPKIRHWLIFPPSILRLCLVCSCSDQFKSFSMGFIINVTDMVENIVAAPSTWL